MEKFILEESLLLAQREINARCPFCGQSIDILIDMSVSEQNYIEDCSVCCRPIQIELSTHNGEIEWINLEKGS